VPLLLALAEVAVLGAGARVGQRVVARALDAGDERLAVVEDVAEVQASDERDAIGELAEVDRRVTADAEARAVPDETDVADRVEERDVDVAAERQPPQRLIQLCPRQPRIHPLRGSLSRVFRRLSSLSKQ